MLGVVATILLLVSLLTVTSVLAFRAADGDMGSLRLAFNGCAAVGAPNDAAIEPNEEVLIDLRVSVETCTGFAPDERVLGGSSHGDATSVEAHAKSPNLDVQVIDRAQSRQPISASQANNWTWVVKSSRAGPLVVTIDLLIFDGAGVEITPRNPEITVETSVTQKESGKESQSKFDLYLNRTQLISGILIGIAGVVIAWLALPPIRRRFGRNEPPDDAAPPQPQPPPPSPPVVPPPTGDTSEWARPPNND